MSQNENDGWETVGSIDSDGWETVGEVKKKEETVQGDYSALSEQLGKRFEDAGSTMQTTKSEEDLIAKKKRIQPELYRLAEESPEKFSSDEGRKGVLIALRKQGYTSSEADIESKRVQEIAINKPIKDNSNRAKSYLKYVSGYGKDASITKVANASDREIEEWTSEMLDKGISQQGIDNAIYDFGNQYRDIKGKEKGEEYDKNLAITAWDRARQSSETGTPTEKEIKIEKDEILKSNLRRYLPEDLKIQAGIEDKVSVILEELKSKKEAGTLTSEERDGYEAKLIGLEKLRNSSDLPDRLFNPVTGEMVDRKDANSETLDYEDRVIREGEKLTDKEKTLQNAKKALHRFEAMDDLYNSEVSFTMRDGRVITAPYREIDSRYADMFDDDSESGRRIAEAKGIKNNWLKAKAQFEAVNRAYSTNTDPAQVDKEFLSSLAEKSVEAFDSGELTTDTDIKFANEYVSLMDDLGSYVTPEQREAAKISFEEKLADATVTSAAIARDIAISALVTRNAGTLLGVGSKLGKLKNLMTNKWGKTGKHIYNISEEMVRGGVTFAPTDATFAEGAGEGLAQGSITALLGKRGQALGRLAELGIRVTGGTATEVVQEYSGQLVNELTTAGVDVDEAFKRTFGRNIEDATDKLLLTATMSAMFSTGFNLNVLTKTRAVLQSELDAGNVPEDKIKDVEDVLKETAPKSEVSVVEEEIKPIEDVPTKEKEEKEEEVTPIEDVKPVETGTEQEARGDVEPDTKQGEVLEKLPKDATVEEKRKYAIDTVLSGQIIERPTGRNIGILAREDFKMPNKEINKAIADIKKGNLETAPAKKLIDKLVDSYDAGGIPVIEGTGGKSVRRREIPIEYFKEGIDEYNRKREYTDSELKEINDIQDELVEDHDSYFKSLTEEEQIEKLDYYERINKEEVSEDTKGTESKSDVVSKTERSPKETAKTKAELIAEANNLKEGEDTRKIMKKAKAAGLSKDAELLEIVSPKAKAYRKKQEKLQKATRDALGIEDEFNYENVFLNEDITDKLEEWKGEKLPKGKLKDAVVEVNKTGNVSKGLDIIKNTDWYKDQSVEKQYEFEYDFKKSLGEDMTGVEKPKSKSVFVRKTERSIIKDKIKSLQQGIKEGRRVESKDLKDMRASLDRYIKETLKGFNLSKTSYGKMKTLIKNVNRKNYDSLIDKVDREFKKLESEDKAKTISDINKFLTSPKTILGKKGKRKVGKVPIEIQQYLKAFDTSRLNEMTRDEVKQIYADLKSVVNEGKKKTKAIERAINAQKRREQGTNFLEFHKTNQGESYTVSGKQNIIDELSNKNRVAIINGQLISSKTKFDESEKEVLERSEEISSLDDFNNFLEDNPNFELDNVTILKTQSQKSAQHNRKKGVGVVLSKYFNPIYRTANLRLNLQPLDKGSKTLRENSDSMAKNAVKSENKLSIESNKKKKQLVDGLEKIYKKYNPKFLGVKTKIGVKTRAKARLSEEADVDISNDIEPFTNSNLIDIYLMSKNPEGKEKLISQEFDIKAINKYMEDNPDLKEYSEFLSDWYNTIAKESYTDIHEKVTKTKFPEGKYYPMYTNKTFNALDESGGIMDDNLNVNPMKAFAGSMVSRVKNKADLDVYIGAFEKANHYINTMERVKQFDKFSEDVSNTFNKATNSEIIKKVGIEKFNNMIDHLSIVITGRDPNSKGKVDGFVNTLMGIKIFGSLGFKTASIPTQLMSFTHFMQSAEVPAKEWIKGFVPVTKGERQAAKAFATSDYVKNRFEGGNIDREYNRFLKGGNISGELLKSTTKLSMLAIRMGDISAVISGGSALSVAVYRREIKAGKSHEEAIKTAVEEASAESETAQQSSLPSQTSKMQRDPVGRLFTAFKTSQIAAKNKMIISAKTLLSDSDLTPKEKTHHISNMLYFAGASVTFAVAKRGFQLAALKSLLMLAKGAMSEDDEKELKRAGYDTLMDNTGSMLDGFGYEGFLLNVLLNKLKGDEWKNAIPLMQEILEIGEGGASGIKFLTNVYASGKEWDDLSDFEKSEIHRLFAASGIIKQFDSWKETVKGEKDFFDAFMNQPTKEKKEKYKKNQNDWLWNQMEGKSDKNSKTKLWSDRFK